MTWIIRNAFLALVAFATSRSCWCWRCRSRRPTW